MKNLAWRCHLKMKIKRFLNNSKAISPIFATLILIAIAVIAGVVVYMFTSGTLATMTGGGTAAQEKVSVQGASIVTTAGTSDAITVYAQSTNNQAVTINSLIIKDSSGSTVATITTVTGGSIAGDGTLAKIAGTLADTTGIITKGNTYSVTLVSSKGGSFVSSTTLAS
jgi:flagellin-like protein